MTILVLTFAAIVGIGFGLFVMDSRPCKKAPAGWSSREAGHPGPCAAWPDEGAD